MRKLTPETLALVNTELLNWLNQKSHIQTLTKQSNAWYNAVRRQQQTYKLLLSLTGLPENKLDDLIYNKTNTSSYWLPDGNIRKEHP